VDDGRVEHAHRDHAAGLRVITTSSTPKLASTRSRRSILVG